MTTTTTTTTTTTIIIIIADPSGRIVLRCGSVADHMLGLWLQITPEA